MRRRALRRRYGHSTGLDHLTKYRGAELISRRGGLEGKWVTQVWVYNSLGRRWLEQFTDGPTRKHSIDRAKRVVDAMKGD